MDLPEHVDLVPCRGVCIRLLTADKILRLPTLSQEEKVVSSIKLPLERKSKRCIFLVERNVATDRYWYQLQLQFCYQHHIQCVPVRNLEEAASYLHRLMTQDAKLSKANHLTAAIEAPGHSGSASDDANTAVLKTIQNFPGIGETKARLLLQSFGTVSGIAKASELELSKHVPSLGPSGARRLVEFFLQPLYRNQ